MLRWLTYDDWPHLFRPAIGNAFGHCCPPGSRRWNRGYLPAGPTPSAAPRPLVFLSPSRSSPDACFHSAEGCARPCLRVCFLAHRLYSATLHVSVYGQRAAARRRSCQPRLCGAWRDRSATRTEGLVTGAGEGGPGVCAVGRLRRGVQAVVSCGRRWRREVRRTRVEVPQKSL